MGTTLMTNHWTGLADTERIAYLEEQEQRLVLASFDPQVAWLLGSILVRHAQVLDAPVLLDVRRGDFVLFRAALVGVSPDQQVWATRKAALVWRMEASSALVGARMQRSGVDPVATGWLGHEYSTAGGSFPVRVAGAGVVAAVTASGLRSDQDHDLVAAALEELITEAL